MTWFRGIFLVLSITLTPTVLADLRSDLRALPVNAIFPGDELYANITKPYNLRFTDAFHPSALTFPSTPQQVSQILQVSTRNNYDVVARSGGHSYIANSLGGKSGRVVIDMRNFTAVTIDSSKTIAEIEPGNRLGQVALALGAEGVAIPHGVCTYVGVGGHAAHGGYGFASRMWGLTLDAVMGAEVVLANGSIVSTSASNNPDLFWALRGAGSSFGITTSLMLQTHPMPPTVTSIEMAWNLTADQGSKSIQSFQSFVISGIPAKLGAEIVFAKGPARGSITMALRAVYHGPSNEVNLTISPFLSTLPPPGSVLFTTGTWLEILAHMGFLGTLDTSNPDFNDTFYAKSVMTPEASPMDKRARDAFVKYMSEEGFDTDLVWDVELELYGGSHSAINAVPLDATAFAHRSSLFTMQFYGSSPLRLPPFPDSGFPFMDAMVQSVIDNSPPDWDYGAYPNYADDRLPQWQHLYYGPHYPKLHRLKQVYDPHGVFSFPTAIED
ncbi:glucooligosaccharide oxidase [Hysterangium stoloniferum]|nr:glucooligosaccharide oxidase [Hysterangium stoloniferum]